MPDVKLFGYALALPRKEEFDAVQSFVTCIRLAVAANLTCSSFPVCPGQVDVHLFRSGTEGYHMVSESKITMEILAYPCAARMANIEDRMQAIAKEINDWLEKNGYGQANISHTFMPVREGNWGMFTPNSP